MIESNDNFLAGVYDLPPGKLNRQSSWTTVLNSVLKAAKGKIRVVQWGTAFGMEQLLQADQVERLVACEHDLERFEVGCRVFARHLASGKLALHHLPWQPDIPGRVLGEYNPKHDFVMQPLRQLGEHAVDLAIIQTENYATDCAEIAQLLVKEGGMILWTGVASWSDPLPDYPSGRTCQEVAANFARRYYLDQHKCLLMLNTKPGQPTGRGSPRAARGDFLAAMFQSLDEADVEFLLLSNPGNLPAIYGLAEPAHKRITGVAPQKLALPNPEAVADIDLLTTQAQFLKAHDCVQACGLPAESPNGGATALYGGGRQQFFSSREQVVRIHLFDSLQYASLDRVHRVGLHARLQQTVMARRRYTPDLWLYNASINDSLLHNLCRCLFDKQAVPDNYATLMEDLYAHADLPALRRDLEFVFFKFASRLEELLQARQAPELYREYIGFQDY
jgi:hypothetical protein